MSQLLVLSQNRSGHIFQERRMEERDQQKWKPVLRPIALSFY
jgi:hypothetical protein